MKLVVLGAGESGVGTAILGKQQGYDVFVSDMGTIKPKYKKKLDAEGIRWEEGQHTEAEILSADEVVKSNNNCNRVHLCDYIRSDNL